MSNLEGSSQRRKEDLLSDLTELLLYMLLTLHNRNDIDDNAKSAQQYDAVCTNAGCRCGDQVNAVATKSKIDHSANYARTRIITSYPFHPSIFPSILSVWSFRAPTEWNAAFPMVNRNRDQSRVLLQTEKKSIPFAILAHPRQTCKKQDDEPIRRRPCRSLPQAPGTELRPAESE